MKENNYTFLVIVDTRAIYIKVKSGEYVLNSAMFGPSGVELTTALIEYLKKNYNILIGRFVAEKLILDLGFAYPNDISTTQNIEGRDLSAEAAKLKKITISTQDIQNATISIINTIVNTVRLNVVQVVPTDLHPTLHRKGISLEGDYAYLQGLASRLEKELGIKVTTYSNL